jgi:hypothetical protein
MSNVQRCFVDWKSLIDKLEIDDLESDEFENDDESLLNEIIDDKCDDEVIINVFS